jgi:glycosyltransferase involved in cell wall biosynthesis
VRIAFLSWRDLANNLAGGSEIFVDRLAVELMELGHEVAHLCGGPVDTRAYPVMDLGGTYSQYLRAPFVHHRMVRDWDLLVDIENGLPFFSPLWRRKPVLALVHHVHSDQWAQRFPPLIAAVGRLTESHVMPLAYRRVPFIANSPSTAAALVNIGVERRRIRILTPGVDPPAIAGVERSSEPLFVCAGRLMPHKRVDLLLRVWEEVRPVVGGRLVVIGDGPERADLEVAAGEGVEFVGRVDEETKWLLLSQAWGLVHCAQHEGWGIVITEAALVGTPSIGFDVPGVRDAIVDGMSGILVDSEQELASRWIEFGTDVSLRAHLSDEARQHGQSFGWSRVAADFVDIATSVIASARSQ